MIPWFWSKPKKWLWLRSMVSKWNQIKLVDNYQVLVFNFVKNGGQLGEKDVRNSLWTIKIVGVSLQTVRPWETVVFDRSQGTPKVWRICKPWFHKNQTIYSLDICVRRWQIRSPTDCKETCAVIYLRICRQELIPKAQLSIPTTFWLLGQVLARSYSNKYVSNLMWTLSP